MLNKLPTLSGSVRPFEAFAASSVIGLALLHLGELPRQAMLHGGAAFVGAWCLFLLLLTLPVMLTELMLGRRAQRSPVEGLAALTREADAKRFWRISGWGMAAAGLLAMVVVALVAGGSINMLARDLVLVDGTVQSTSAATWVLPVGTAVLLLLATGLFLPTAKWQKVIVPAGLGLVVLLLLVASLFGISMVPLLYPAKGLSMADWQAAVQMALLSAGAGLGVFWMMGASLPEKSSIARLSLLWLVTHALLGAVLMLALAPFVAVEQIKAQMSVEIVPTGMTVWLVVSTLILLSLLALLSLLSPAVRFLEEKGLARMSAIAGVLGAALVIALGVWGLSGVSGAAASVQALWLLLVLVLGVQSVFAGWGMKVSHARKALNLPSEGIYNLWRVVVRLAVPLVLLWVLVGMVTRAVA